MFDETIGHLQSILLGKMARQVSLVLTTIPITEDGFSDIHQTFLEEHYSHFDDSEENKFIYTDIFKQYVSIFLNMSFVTTSLPVID